MKTTNGSITVAEIISTLVLARHGNTNKATAGQKDADRTLTQLGLEQATKLAEVVGDIDFSLVVSSPLKRAMYTTELATCYAPMPVAELGCTDDPNDPINIMFGKLGYALLGAYFEHELGEHLKVWARSAANSVLEHAKVQSGRDGKPINVFAGGHAVCQNALLWALAEKMENATDRKQLTKIAMNTALGEAHAFIVDFSNNTEQRCTVIQTTVPVAQ